MDAEDNRPSSTTEEDYQPFPDPLLGSGEDLSPGRDGGVLKAVRRAGDVSELDRPMKGDQVFVHYVGTLVDGTLFDSSRSRGERFSFTLGQGQVIKAWDLGVATMRRGEIAVFTCKPEYAYGKQAKPKIPANSTLVFEVELFDWKGEDLTPDRDGGVVRRTFVPGEGYDTPNEEAKVEIHLIGTCNGREFEKRDVEFLITEGKSAGIVSGVEMGLQRMKKGEVARLQLKPGYAFGAEGSAQFDIPGNADVVYDVKLKNFEKAKEAWEMDSDEKLEASEKVKAKGTDFFKQGRYQDAVRQWRKIVTFLETESSLAGEKKQKAHDLQLAANLNIAMATIKTEEYLDSITCCDKAIELDPSSVKGHFRRGLALSHMAEYERSKVDFQKVLELDPGNTAARKQLSLSNQKLKQHRQREKQIYGNMFARFAQQDLEAKLARERARGDLEVGVFDENGKAREGPASSSPLVTGGGDGDGLGSGAAEEEAMDVEGDRGVTRPVEEGTGQTEEGTGQTEEGTGPAEEGTGPVEEGTGPAEEGTGPAEKGTSPAEGEMENAEAEENTHPAADNGQGPPLQGQS